jgi:hypothetical protein
MAWRLGFFAGCAKLHMMSLRFKHLPPHLVSINVSCETCGKLFPVPFFDEGPQPLKPVIPLDYHPITNNVQWTLVSQRVRCPTCPGYGTVAVPSVKLRGIVRLFGDEASRKHGQQEVFTYSLVGADPQSIVIVCDKLNGLKAKWAPTLPPSDWRMHMREAWSGDARTGHPVYCSWDRSKVKDYIEETLNLLHELRDILFVFNVSVAGPGRLQEPRDMAYTSLLLSCINTLTEKGTRPEFVFDSDRVCGEEGSVVGWAERLLEVKQRTLLYAFLARGLVIPEPRFVQPGSHPCLELADFVSFWIARYHLHKWQRREPEFETDRLGRIFYLGVRNNGDLGYWTRKGFPWDFFYA